MGPEKAGALLMVLLLLGIENDIDLGKYFKSFPAMGLKSRQVFEVEKSESYFSCVFVLKRGWECPFSDVELKSWVKGCCTRMHEKT